MSIENVMIVHLIVALILLYHLISLYKMNYLSQPFDYTLNKLKVELNLAN